MEFKSRKLTVTAFTTLLSITLLSAQAFAAQPAGKGKPNKGGGDAAIKCISDIGKAHSSHNRCAALPATDIIKISPEIFDTDGNTVLPEWVEVFSDTFTPSSVDNPDAVGVLDWTRWNSRLPWGDWKINGVSGEDHWNVNTTGLEPGIGWDSSNYFPDMDKFLNILADNNKHVFAIETVNDSSINTDNYDADADNDQLVISSYTNPWRKNLNKRKKFVSGLISSHVGPTTDSTTAGTHGFQFRYGYIEVRAKMPQQGNGFRSAIWLYSDNAYINALNGASPVYEIDIAEHIANTRVDQDGEQCFVQQDSSFWPNIGAGTDDVGRLSYASMFHTYHYPGNRTSSEWVYNSNSIYDPVRCDDANGPDIMDYAADFHTYGVLWEEDRIEFYVDRRLIHQVRSDGVNNLPAGLTEAHPIASTPMYMIINLAMGLDGFEGNVDESVFVNGDGPKLAIDYVKVWQHSDVERNHGWCGKGGDATCQNLTAPQ